MLCKISLNAEKEMLHLGEKKNIVIHSGDLSRGDSVWEKNNWKECGGLGGVGRETFQKFQSF